MCVCVKNTSHLVSCLYSRLPLDLEPLQRNHPFEDLSVWVLVNGLVMTLSPHVSARHLCPASNAKFKEWSWTWHVPFLQPWRECLELGSQKLVTELIWHALDYALVTELIINAIPPAPARSLQLGSQAVFRPPGCSVLKHTLHAGRAEFCDV